jgi:hypothetical protein
MPITKLDTTAALIVMDLQEGIVSFADLPVVLVNVTGVAPGRTDAGRPTFSRPTDWTELVPELERHSDDYLGQPAH